MNKPWLIAVAVWLVCALVMAGDADAFGLCRRDCVPPCPPPPPQMFVLQVCHPCTGCKYEVPVCIPACCTGEPCVRFEKTLIGYGKTVFEWSCGHKVIVRYPHGGGYRVIERG
jgi:hypothetical protein